MAHRFNVRHAVTGATLPEIRRLMAAPDFHESVARKVPGFNLKILASTPTDRGYLMKREVNMDVNIPDIAKKFLKDAFKVWRTEEWDIDTLTCRLHMKLNMPAELYCTIALVEEGGAIVADHDWEVDVHVPVIHGILARHAEAEIRRFNQIEIETVQREIHAHLVG